MAKVLGKGTVVTLGAIVGVVRTATPFKSSRPIIQGEELVPESGTEAEHELGDYEPQQAEVTFYCKKGTSTLAGLRTLADNAQVDAGRVQFTISNGASGVNLNEVIHCRIMSLDPQTITRDDFIQVSATLLKVPAPPT